VDGPVRIGDVLDGKYRVERVLGEGGMGVVVAAEHLLLGGRVALKFLLPETARDAELVSRFRREARAASKIQSEHVARVMDVGALHDGAPYLVMEFLEGRDLAAELRARGSLPVAEAVDLVLQAAVGVAEAHALGIVHRDIKPSNLFLARMPNGRTVVKVLDFGVAKLAEATDLTHSFSALGSVSYMSPEQVRAAKNVDVRTDVWALGVVLYELLTGAMPFEGESVTAIAASIVADLPRPLESHQTAAPAQLRAAVMACLEKQPARRVPSMGALATALGPFGGSNASLHVARVTQALSAPEPEENDEARATAPSLPSAPADIRPIAIERRGAIAAQPAITRPTWSTTASGASKQLARRIVYLAVSGGALLTVLALIVAWRVAARAHTGVAPAGVETVTATAPVAQATLSGEASSKVPAPAAASATATATQAGVSPEALPIEHADAGRKKRWRPPRTTPVPPPIVSAWR
jgi:eukaryotic-like serine/threonine-protein kinase